MDGRSFPRLRSTYRLLYDSAQAWIDNRAMRLAAGVAYYALFALIPVLFLSLTIASVFLGQAVDVDVEQAISDFLGPEPARAIINAVDSIDIGGSRLIVSLASLGVLLFASSLLFVAWKEVVDILFGVPRQRGVRASIRRRVFGLAAVLGAGVLLTLNLAVGALVGLIDEFLSSQILDVVVRVTGSFAAIALGVLFVGILFKFTPNEEVSWREVWFASVVSMTMLVAGAWGYGVYLDVFGFTSAAGVAGALVLGLALVYYAAAILLYGMEIVRFAQLSEEFVPLAFRPFQGVSG
ncbi:MAG: YihY/virulence factor BrkB family protein [Acidimicrobiia bacterium]